MNDPMIGKIIAGRFEVLERIGEGGYSVIYRANQIGVDRPVAIKVLAAHVAADPSWVARFHASARALARVSHPHAVQIYDFGQTADGLHFMAMELLPGRSLRAVFDREGILRPRRALRIVAQAARALGAVHAEAIIHRDFKPESVLLTALGREPEFVKVLFSTVLRSRDPNSPRTPVGVVFGTPWYMSPEQALGRPIGPESDLYAAGVVLYEALAGRKPFDDPDPITVAVMHCRNAPPPIPGVSGIVGAILERVLAKDPTARYPSGDALARDCEGAAEFVAD